MNFSACSAIAFTTGAGECPTASMPRPPARSISVLLSTSKIREPSARSMTMSVARAWAGNVGVQPYIRGGVLPRRAWNVLARIEHDQDAVVVANWIVEIVRDQRLRFESNRQLHRQRRILHPSGDHPFVVLLRGHAIL